MIHVKLFKNAVKHNSGIMRTVVLSNHLFPIPCTACANNINQTGLHGFQIWKSKIDDKRYRLENWQLLMKNQSTKILLMLTKPHQSGSFCPTDWTLLKCPWAWHRLVLVSVGLHCSCFSAGDYFSKRLLLLFYQLKLKWQACVLYLHPHTAVYCPNFTHMYTEVITSLHSH